MMQRIVWKITGTAIALVSLAGTPSAAQQQNQADWEVSFDSEVNWTRVTPFGALIVSTEGGLHGVDTETGTVTWSRPELRDLDEERYHPIPRSPYVRVAPEGERSPVFVLETFEGTIVFNSAEAGIERVRDHYVLPQSLTLLVQGYAPGQDRPSVYMIDLTTGQRLWEKHDQYGMFTSFHELDAQHFIFSTMWHVSRIDTKTGEVLWQEPLDVGGALVSALGGLGKLLGDMAESTVDQNDIVSEIHVMPDEDRFLIAAQVRMVEERESRRGQKFEAESFTMNLVTFRLSTGEKIWPRFLELDGRMGAIMLTDRGVIAGPNHGGGSRINLYDYETGEGQWGDRGRGERLRGGLVRFEETDAGTVVVLEDGDRDSKLNILDPATGALTFERPVEIKGKVEHLEMVGGGLFYATDREADIIDLASGETRFDKPIETESNLALSADDAIYVFSPKKKRMFRVDRSTLSAAQIGSGDIRFEGGEQPNAMELRGDGLLLIGMQNLALVGRDGELTFHAYHREPRQSGILRALNTAMAIRAATFSAAAKVYAVAAERGAQQADNAMDREMARAMGEGFSAMSDAGFSYADAYWQAANARVQATTNSPDFVFMVTRGDRDNRLVRVNKGSGDVLDYVSLGSDRDPEYQVDNVINQIYYRSDSNRIVSYKF